jgi:outer membrane protein assembly factor BamB
MRWFISPQLVFALFVVGTSFVETARAADPLDWPYWRGPEGNSISRETGLPATLKPTGGEGSNLLWKSEDAGGRSTPIVINGKLYTLVRDKPGTKEEGEKVICLNAATGEPVWENRFNVWSSDVPDTRVGWSSVVGDPETGKVYALGVCGLFQCIDGESGKTLWSIPLHEQYGMLSTYGGRTNYPVVCDDLVILGAVFTGWGEYARPAHRLMGFDKATGTVRWISSTKPLPEDTIHSGPTLCVIQGQKLLLTGSGDGWLYAIQPRTGKIVWEFRFSRRGLNVSPTVVGETVFMGHSEENPPPSTKMGAVAAVNGALSGNITKSGELWNEIEIGVGKSSILAWDGKLYCPDDAGKLFILDQKTGKPIGRKLSLGTMNYASPLYADGRIYHMEKNARCFIIDPKTAKFTKINFPTGDECWASPVVSHGRLYIQTTGALYCFEDTKKEHGSSERPEQPAEAGVADDTKVAQLQIVPAEALLKPDETQSFEVLAFNSKGQRLDQKVEAKFEVSGPGKISEGGEFSAPADAGHTAAFVVASAGDVKSRARIRIVPTLPWKFDFEGLNDAPITWVGARYRHVMRNVMGNNVMVKITTIPKGTRSRLWMGPSDLHDYTVQADFRPSTADNKLPNFGVTAQGYKLAVEPTDEASGTASKKLILNSWDSHDHRIAKRQSFNLDPNLWYTLKLKVTNTDGKALVQGKIWKRDSEDEPADWTIEMTDTRPVTQAAPGMHCDATDAEIFIDNVVVTPNGSAE